MLCGCSVCHSAILAATIWGFGAARQDIWHAFFLFTYTFFLKQVVLGCHKPRELIAWMPSSPMIIFMIQTNFSLKHNIKPYQNCSHVIMTKTFCCKLEHLCLIELLKDWRESLNDFFDWLKHNFGSPAEYEFVLKLAGFVVETPCAPISIHFVWEAYFTFQLLPFQGERKRRAK